MLVFCLEMQPQALKRAPLRSASVHPSGVPLFSLHRPQLPLSGSHSMLCPSLKSTPLSWQREHCGVSSSEAHCCVASSTQLGSHALHTCLSSCFLSASAAFWRQRPVLLFYLLRLRFRVHVPNGLSHVRLLVTPWTVAHRTPLSVGFPRQEYWIQEALNNSFLN